MGRQLDEVLTTTASRHFRGQWWYELRGRSDRQDGDARQARPVHAFIRNRIFKGTPILYGGSVKPDNAVAIFAMPDVDGGLIGGASLVAKDCHPALGRREK